MIRAFSTLLALFFALSFAIGVVAQTQPHTPSGAAELHRLDLLPRFRRSVKVGSVSSYDRTGGNEDGFSGKYSFVRKEPRGLVIADLQGPGVITRIWTPTPTDDIVEFYFDGEAEPRIGIKFRDLFTGVQTPFLAPVAGFGAGGFYSYVPLPYAKSCKVIVRAEKIEFYQINFATYAAETPVESYSARGSGEFDLQLKQARELFARAGSDVSSHAAGERAHIERRAVNLTLAPNKSATVFETDRPGRIVGLKLAPASAFAGKERDVLLRVYWDGDRRAAIECPVGDFFGYAWGQPAMRSLVLGTNEDVNYAYLPMPFDRAARIELVSQRGGGVPLQVRGEIAYTDQGRRADEGKLYAVWRRENPTAEGRPYTFVDARGRGHLVGAILQAQGSQPGAIPEFFEGDDETTIDGETVIRGTGSEDFFNGGWYDVPGRWESRVSLPLSGALEFKRHLARTGGYRFMLADAYPFRDSIRQTIEHGPAGNKIPTDYASVTFLYAEHLSVAGESPVAPERRRVVDPVQVVFTPGWTTPIHAFSWSNAVLMKRDDRVGDEQIRHLSMRAEGREVFGAHYISFICEMPAAGRYRISIQGIEGPDQGRIQIFRDEVGIGTAVDLYAAVRRKSGVLTMAELDLREGDNRVMFKSIGKNEKSTAINFDLHRIIFERME